MGSVREAIKAIKTFVVGVGFKEHTHKKLSKSSIMVTVRYIMCICESGLPRPNKLDTNENPDYYMPFDKEIVQRLCGYNNYK